MRRSRFAESQTIRMLKDVEHGHCFVEYFLKKRVILGYEISQKVGAS